MTKLSFTFFYFEPTHPTVSPHVYMSTAQKLVLWQEQLWQEWAKKLTPEEARVLMMVCKRWRVLCFRPSFFFSVWTRPKLFNSHTWGVHSYVVQLGNHRSTLWWGLYGVYVEKNGDVRFISSKRGLRGALETKLKPSRRVLLQLFVDGWGQLYEKLFDK